VICKEVERLRAGGLKGVQRTRVKDKDYDTDLETFKTYKDTGEWAGTLAVLGSPVTPLPFGA
jgi:hypothetical protein